MSEFEPTVSIFAELPESLHESVQQFLKDNPSYDCDRLFAAALSLFLIQNCNTRTLPGEAAYRNAAKVYLDNLFKEAA